MEKPEEKFSQRPWVYDEIQSESVTWYGRGKFADLQTTASSVYFVLRIQKFSDQITI